MEIKKTLLCSPVAERVLPPEDAPALASMMSSVVCLSTGELVEKGRVGFDYAMQHFSRKNNLSKITKTITDILSYGVQESK
jgi:hypothetical protein